MRLVTIATSTYPSFALGLLLLIASAACSPAARSAADSSADSVPAGKLDRPASLPAYDPAVPGVAVGIHGAVSSAEEHASRVGLSILKRGGNAIDAAVAVAFALAVTHPTAGNIGGGGFMLVRLADGSATAIDYRETAPLAATADMFLDPAGNLTGDSVVGPRAAGIPGTVAGLALAHRRFGTLPWADLLADAIRLSREGHVPDAFHLESMADAARSMREAGFAETARLYSAPDGAALAAGQVWQQAELAGTLEAIAEHGPSAFYEGPLAERIVSAMRSIGGVWQREDLSRYRALERTPIGFDYLGHHVLSMPPPSSGGIVLRQILGASELLDMRSKPWRSAQAFHLYVEAARRAYADRNQLLGDPDFIQVPTATLISTDYIRARIGDIDPERATPSDKVSGGAIGNDSPQTTHFSIVDAAGNAVSNTYTLNTGFGANVAIPGTGILLNNEMDDFAAKPGSPNTYGLVQSAANAIAPGKRMLSSMTPTIVLKDGKLRAVIGSPGGPTIINTVAQIIRALIDYGRPLDEAVVAPRLHHQWKPDVIMLETSVEPEIEQGLTTLGHNVQRRGKFGHANCIEVDPATHGLRAVADVTRTGGSALAY
jgi:gamma-glutamyltranspeptidase / glutathione hydrolase